MATIGKWVDSLTDEQADRIITEPEFYPGNCFVNRFNNTRCLVGAAFNFMSNSEGYEMAERNGSVYETKRFPWSRRTFLIVGGKDNWVGAANRFTKLCQRFGVERITRTCKLRAARRRQIVLLDSHVVTLEVV